MSRMDVATAIKTRRTAHSFHGEPIPEEVLANAFECAIRAPNHKLSNPWRFIRTGPIARAQIVEFAVELKTAKSPGNSRLEAKVREQVGSSPELIVVVQQLDEDPMRRKEDFASCACAIQNLCLALWGEGVHTKWGTGGPTRDPRTYELLGLDPARQEIIGFVFAGYADEQPQTPRLPVADVVSCTP